MMVPLEILKLYLQEYNNKAMATIIKKQRKKPKYQDTELSLRSLQDKYLATRDRKYYDEMFVILKDYARSIVLKKVTGKVFLSAERVEGVAVDATLKIMSGYLKDPNYKCNSSFGGWVNFPILAYLYGPKVKKNDRTISLNIKINDNDGELLDTQENLHIKNYYDENVQASPEETFLEKVNVLEEEIHQIFVELKSSVSPITYLKVNEGVLLFFRKPKLKNFTENFEATLTPAQKKAYQFTISEIYERIKASQILT